MHVTALAELSRAIVSHIRSDEAPLSCWQKVLEITEQSDNAALNSFDLKSEVMSVSSQVSTILQTSPMPTAVRSLYFGLFDRQSRNGTSVGYYIAGYEDASGNQVEFGKPALYFPPNRFVESRLLNVIKKESQEREGYDREVLDYAVMFGAAAILSRSAGRQLNVKLPIYVGFDEGDYAGIT